MTFIEKIKIRLKNVCNPYAIYKIGDKYAVRITIFCNWDDCWVEWMEDNGTLTWSNNIFRNNYCLVNSCEEAFKVIEQYKKSKIEYKVLKKALKIKNKERYAYECYSDGE